MSDPALDEKLIDLCKLRPGDEASLALRKALIGKLLTDGASVAARDTEGRNALWWAAANLDRACCELLLDAGATDVTDVNKSNVLQSAVEHGNLETTVLLLDRGRVATESLVALADRYLYMKLASELRKRAGLPDPFAGDPRAALVILATQLGHHARSSAESSGDLAHYEDREDLDPDDLCIEYWIGHYKGIVREAFDALGDTERAALPEREAMLEELYESYCAGYDSASGS